MIATLDRMSKKPKKGTEKPASRPATDVVRIDADLARKVGIISNATGISSSDLLSPYLRPFIEKKFAETVAKLADEVKGGPSDSDE